MRTVIVILSLSLLAPIELLAQSRDFVISTFSAKRKGPDKHFADYTWVVPTDSIKIKSGSEFAIYPLVLDDTLIDEEIRDCSGKVSFLLLSEYDYAKQNSASIIRKHRRLIQSITVKWNAISIKGHKPSMKLKVYATPVRGVLCSCFQSPSTSVIYYTSKDLEYLSNFWNTPQARDILGANYLNMI